MLQHGATKNQNFYTLFPFIAISVRLLLFLALCLNKHIAIKNYLVFKE